MPTYSTLDEFRDAWLADLARERDRWRDGLVHDLKLDDAAAARVLATWEVIEHERVERVCNEIRATIRRAHVAREQVGVVH